MMKFPTVEELAQNVAEKALDEIEYNGKTIRQWIEIIVTDSEDKISRRATVDAMDSYCENTCPIREDRWCPDCQIEELKKIVLCSATDINVATNDAISRRKLQEKFEKWQKTDGYSNDEWNLLVDVLNVIKSMPQLSTNLAEVGTDVPEINVGELISRQQASYYRGDRGDRLFEGVRYKCHA